MRLARKFLKNIADGDDERIRKVVLQNRPNDTMKNQ